jgi:hypothetical protein
MTSRPSASPNHCRLQPSAPPRRDHDSDQPHLRVATATLTSRASASAPLQYSTSQRHRDSDLSCLCVDVATIHHVDTQPFHTYRGFEPPLPTCRTSTSTPLWHVSPQLWSDAPPWHRRPVCLVTHYKMAECWQKKSESLLWIEWLSCFWLRNNSDLISIEWLSVWE